MILLGADFDSLPANQRVAWEQRSTTEVSGSEPWLRGTRRAISRVRDEQGHAFPLRVEHLWVNVTPAKHGVQWRAEAEMIGNAVVGRGETPRDALTDWRKRFRATVQRFFAMRPFEMTGEDKSLWEKIQAVIDVPLYKATKPMTILQTGIVHRVRGAWVTVRWSDGAKERVKIDRFDELFSRFSVGQPFEATVTRHPTTFRLVRAEAVRRVPPAGAMTQERSRALWEKVVGGSVIEPTPPDVDEAFWLKPRG